MFFELSKLVGLFTIPSNLIFMTGLIGLVLLRTRFSNLGMRLLVLSYVLLAVVGMTPLGYALMLPLEERFPQWQMSPGVLTGIVVLGGVIAPELSVARGEIALHEAAERVTAVAELSHRFPKARIVFSGGNGDSTSSIPPEADLAKHLFESFGISDDRILLEPRSRNTAENAKLTKALINPITNERWLLVTSAAHMPRAIGAFRKVGFPVEAYPVVGKRKASRTFGHSPDPRSEDWPCAMLPCMSGLDFWPTGLVDGRRHCFRVHELDAAYVKA
jgi:uncharacterized SAM-binding protein YcdF (DUF218 family)